MANLRGKRNSKGSERGKVKSERGNGITRRFGEEAKTVIRNS